MKTGTAFRSSSKLWCRLEISHRFMHSPFPIGCGHCHILGTSKVPFRLQDGEFQNMVRFITDPFFLHHKEHKGMSLPCPSASLVVSKRALILEQVTAAPSQGSRQNTTAWSQMAVLVPVQVGKGAWQPSRVWFWLCVLAGIVAPCHLPRQVDVFQLTRIAGLPVAGGPRHQSMAWAACSVPEWSPQPTTSMGRSHLGLSHLGLSSGHQNHWFTEMSFQYAGLPSVPQFHF